MKVSIDKTGILIVKAENHLEAYALRKWCEENSKAFEGSKFIVEFNLQDSIESKSDELI